MKFSDIKRFDLNISEAADYLLLHEGELNSIYESKDPDAGIKGWVWRQLNGKPSKTSPLLLFLTEKIVELESEINRLKSTEKNVKKESNELKKNISQTRKKLEKAVSTQVNLEHINKKLENRLDDETAKCLMESIIFLSKKVTVNDINFKIEELPHYEKLDIGKINYLKSLILTH